MSVVVTHRRVGHPIVSDTPKALSSRARFADRRRRGICTQCGIRRTQGKALCRTCCARSLSRQAALRHARKATGDCQECGKPANFKTRCPSCVTRRNNRQSRQREWRAPEYARRRKGEPA